MRLKSEDLDLALEEAGSEHRYQYLLLLSFIFLKIVTDSFSCPLPFFLMDPKIKCLDKQNNFTKECHICEICHEKKSYYKNLTKTRNYTINDTDVIPEFISKKFKIDENIGKSFSFITEFNLECNDLIKGLLASSASIGYLISNIIGPILSENLGRILTIRYILIFDIIVKGSMLFVPNVNFLLFYILVINFNNNIIYNCLGLIINEMVSKRKRGLFFCVYNSITGISGIIYTIIFNIYFSWKIMQIFSTITSFVSLIISVFFIKESIRFLYMNKQENEIFETLRYIAKINGRTSNLEAFKIKFINNSEICTNTFNNSKNINTDSNNEKNVFTKIFSNKDQIFDFLIFNFISLVIISGNIYRSIEIAMTSDIFLNPIIFYLIDLIIILIIGFVIETPYLGRKKPSIFFSILAGIFLLIKYFDILKHLSSSKLWQDIIIRQSIGITFNIFMQYNYEIYSTDIRSTAFNINKIFSRIGDFITPIILTNNRALCTLILVIFYLLTSIIVLKLRETQGELLRENITEETDKDKEEKNHININEVYIKDEYQNLKD